MYFNLYFYLCYIPVFASSIAGCHQGSWPSLGQACQPGDDDDEYNDDGDDDDDDDDDDDGDDNDDDDD